DPEAGDQLLRLRERPVDDRAVLAGEAHARTLRARLQSLAGEHDARLRELLVESAHLLQQLLARHHAGLAVGGRSHHHHESHQNGSFRSWTASTPTTNE